MVNYLKALNCKAKDHQDVLELYRIHFDAKEKTVLGCKRGRNISKKEGGYWDKSFLDWKYLHFPKTIFIQGELGKCGFEIKT
jgi:hypothetical protein